MNIRLQAVALLTAAFSAACGNTIQMQTPDLVTDSVTFENKNGRTEVYITADFPTAGNAALTNIIREYISEELGGTYRGDLTDAQAMLAFYGERLKNDIDEIADADEREDAPSLLDARSIAKTYETDKFVVYTSVTETYHGGAHGMHTATATTFRKADGRRFGHEMLIGTDSEGFRTLIKEGLKQYFSEQAEDTISDEVLKDILLTDSSIDFLPLPQHAPQPSKDGMTFTYQPYEIAPYAAGMPSFTIPYDKIKPYVTAAVIDMIE